jgi:hypothetical protein
LQICRKKVPFNQKWKNCNTKIAWAARDQTKKIVVCSNRIKSNCVKNHLTLFAALEKFWRNSQQMLFGWAKLTLLEAKTVKIC